MNYRVELSVYDDYVFDHKPTADEINALIDIMADDLTKGYITPDIGLYADDDVDEGE